MSYHRVKHGKVYVPALGAEMPAHLAESDPHPQYIDGTELAFEVERRAPAENGFVDRAESTLSFDDVTRVLTITPVGDSFTYYHKSTKYVKHYVESVVIAADTGLNFIYYDQGVLTNRTTFEVSLIEEHALVAVIYYDAAAVEGILFGDERHGNVMDHQTHLYNHLTFGARFQSGLNLGNMSVDASGNLATSAQFSVNNGIIWDEDIKHTIADGDPQELSTIAEIPIYYRFGASGVWKKVAATQYPVATSGSGRAAWNDYTIAWVLQETTNNRFVVYHYFATNNIAEPIIGIMGQAEYTTKNAARDGAEVEIHDLQYGQLDALTPEYVAIASVIWQTSTAYGNAVKSRTVSTGSGDDYVDWRFATGGSGGTAGTTYDADAIHNNVPAEISAVTAKATPIAADYLIIEDSADGDSKKSITISDLEAVLDSTYLKLDCSNDPLSADLQILDASATATGVLVENSNVTAQYVYINVENSSGYGRLAYNNADLLVLQNNTYGTGAGIYLYKTSSANKGRVNDISASGAAASASDVCMQHKNHNGSTLDTLSTLYTNGDLDLVGDLTLTKVTPILTLDGTGTSDPEVVIKNGTKTWTLVNDDTNGDLTFKSNTATLVVLKADGTIQMKNLPTASAGLATDTIWSNSNVLNIIP